MEHKTSPLSPSLDDTQPARPRNPWVRVVVYLVLAGLLGLVGWRIYQNKQKASDAKTKQAAALMNRPVPVQVTPVEQKPMPIYLTALGTVTPNMSVTVKARVGGQLLPVRFVEGQEVRKGQTILQIDPSSYKAALDQAKGTLAHDQALLNNAKTEYARYKALYDAGVVSKEVMETDEATMGQYQGAIQSDEAAVENAALQLSWCNIQSPIDGRIGLRLVDPGNQVTANTTNLVVINQFRPIAVYFTLPESQLPPVLQKLAAEHRMAVDAYDRSDVNKLAAGTLLTADNQIDTTTGTDKLKAVFANENEVLFPNQFVNIHLVLENRPHALVVPTAAIQSGVDGSFVWVIAKNAQGKPVAQMQAVKVAMAEGQNTILDSGPAAGAQVVIDGAEKLQPSQLVEVSAPHRQGNGQAPPAAGDSPFISTSGPGGKGHASSAAHGASQRGAL
ncbi:MAG TPA: efflux RND transporter periplasmic adaptor subunit [Terracidiphilus sp.]|nr:efflux RND transporter periplasmic adaptor subunit [Terracidiphilus sp.]